MKARYALWPVMIFSAVSLASACSSSSSSSTSATGGADGTGDGGTNSSTGATNAMGNNDAAGMSATSDAGAPSATPGGAAQGGASTGTTTGAGGAGGAAGDLCEGQNLDCPDDNNPCTEDACNPATGTCGIPRSDTACDDGVFCNGADSCDAGKCTVHAGNDCSGTCNEAGKYCECTIKADCPADEPGAWGECTYASTCAQSTMRTRPVTKYSCNNVGKCVGAAAVESEPCSRNTEGTTCEDDGNRCNGAEKCKQGSCVPEGTNPCQGQASTPYCYTSGTECRACTGSGASSVGCGSAQFCCYGTCKANGSSCLITTTIIIDPTLIQTISLTTLAQ